jgi:CRISPR-associated protein Cas1
MKQSLRTYDVIGFKAAGNTQLRCLQYNYDGLGIAKHITVNKILNQRAALMRQRYRGDDINEAICALKRYAGEVPAANSLQSIMGVEGAAAKLYFGQNFNNAKWVARRPRVKCDYINATLDLGYSLLFNLVESMRKSLVCDLVEPFRPLVDLCIRTAISHNQCKVEDFEIKNGALRLDWAKNKAYILFLLKPLLENKNEMFRYIRDYYRCFAQSKPADEFPVFEIR